MPSTPRHLPRDSLPSSPTTPTTPTTPTLPHERYESFSDLVSPASRRSSVQKGKAKAGTPSSKFSTPASNKRWSNWISDRSRSYSSDLSIGEDESSGQEDDEDDDGGEDAGEEREGEGSGSQKKQVLGTRQMIALTVGLAGAQLAWTVEMAFGTPYLLTLGLTKGNTSLVWLAGPLSGLLVQPAIGALSDSSPSSYPYRRRFYILLSAILVFLSTLQVAFARAIAVVFSTMLGGKLGDWDPREEEQEKRVAVWVAVSGFYILDFALNGLQASLRALILDQCPASQQPTANAWHGRMTHLGNIFGYLAGYIELGHWGGLSWVGGGQFRKVAVLSCCVMLGCVSFTCWTQREEVSEEGTTERDGESANGGGNRGLGEEEKFSLKKTLRNVRKSVRTLPKPVQRVCFVQFFAWTAFFPFLFYSTTWVVEVLYASVPAGQRPPSEDAATRQGSLALLLFALSALISGSILPFLTTLGRRPFIDAHISRSTKKGRFIRVILSEISPRNIWSAGLGMYALIMLSTFWVTTVDGTKIVLTFVGVPWAINCWVPFALVMESIRDAAQAAQALPPSPPETPSPTTRTNQLFRPLQPFRAELRQPSLSRSNSASGRYTQFVGGGGGGGAGGRNSSREEATESSPLIISTSPNPSHDPSISSRPDQQRRGSGATILGIHNIAIVLPQFFVAIVAAIIFRVVDASNKARSTIPGDDGGLQGSNDVVWVLRFGGLAALGGMVVSRWLLKTKTEKRYVAHVLREEPSGIMGA